MSVRYKDQNIEYAIITLKNRTTAGTFQVVAGREYFAPNALAAGSGAVYPLLVDSPTTIKSVGDHIGVRNDISLQLYARQPIDVAVQGLIDYRETYEFYRARVEIYYAPKPSDTALGLTSEYIRKQLCDVIDVQYSDDIITFTCRDLWFEDFEISERLPAATGTFADLQPQWANEYGAIPFGSGVVIDAPILDNDLSANFVNLFIGWNHHAGFPIRQVNNVYAQNLTPDLDSRSYIDITSPTTPVAGLVMIFAGIGSAVPFHLGQFWRSLLVIPSAGALISSFQADIEPNGAIPVGDGDIVVELFAAQPDASNSVYVPIGSPLAARAIEPASLTGGVIRSLGFDRIVPLISGQPYVLTFRYSNRDNVTQYPIMNVANTIGKSHFALDRSAQDKGWALQSNVELGAGLFGYDPSTISVNTTYSTRFSQLSLIDSNNLSPVYTNPSARLNFKVSVDGINDTSGVYGTVNALVNKPIDVLLYCLTELPGSPSSITVDTTTATSVRAAQNLEGFQVKTAITDETYFYDFAIQLCKQFRTIFYYCVSEDKYKFFFHEPVPASGSTQNKFSQVELQDDLQLTELIEEPIERVFNDFFQRYDINELETPLSEQFLRKAQSDKFLAAEELNGSASTSGDAIREAKCALSESLYGNRKMRFDLALHANQVSARKYQEYACDRFHLRHQQIRVRVPRKYYYSTVEILESAEAEHVKIGSTTGHIQHNYGPYVSGTTTVGSVQTNYPQVAWGLGRKTGRITAIQEQGPYMWVTFVTDGGPSSY